MRTVHTAPILAVLLAACDSPTRPAFDPSGGGILTTAGEGTSTSGASTGAALDSTTTGAETTGPIEGSTTTTAADSSSGGESSTGGSTTGGTTGEASTGAAESSTSTGAESSTGEASTGPEQLPQFCTPGAAACAGEGLVQVCDDEGAAYLPPVACPAGETCQDGACLTACELAALEPSSVGCSFLAARLDNHKNAESQPAAVIVGNSSAVAATVQLFRAPLGGGIEVPEGEAVIVPPGGVATFALPTPPLVQVSGVRKGGTYRVTSDRPIAAYQYSPLAGFNSNDASLLLPEYALTGSYVVASYPGNSNGTTASYFHVIAAHAGTTVEWTAAQATKAGDGVAAVAAGAVGAVLLDRHDSLQVRPVSGIGDVSGTVISASAPVWVVGAAACANVPAPAFGCDHLQEQLLPLEYWGQQYVAAPSPSRGTEPHHWRIYGGDDGVTVTTDPPQPGTPLELDRGEWVELVAPHGVGFVFKGDGPFMPVQYLASQGAGAGTGDPSMYQAIPVEQYLSRYVFAAGTNYDAHYAQITRPMGAPDVQIDGVTVTGYHTIGGFEVADWPIGEGPHQAESVQTFGVSVIGYRVGASYAFPGGLRLDTINPQ